MKWLASVKQTRNKIRAYHLNFLIFALKTKIMLIFYGMDQLYLIHNCIITKLL